MRLTALTVAVVGLTGLLYVPSVTAGIGGWIIAAIIVLAVASHVVRSRGDLD